MTYQIAFSAQSLTHLQTLTVRQQRIILTAITEQLSYEPTVPTRNRKQMRPNPLALWELRVGDLRVYYDIDEEDLVVDIRAVGRDAHSTRRIFEIASCCNDVNK